MQWYHTYKRGVVSVPHSYPTLRNELDKAVDKAVCFVRHSLSDYQGCRRPDNRSRQSGMAAQSWSPRVAMAVRTLPQALRLKNMVNKSPIRCIVSSERLTPTTCHWEDPPFDQFGKDERRQKEVIRKQCVHLERGVSWRACIA
jgi:hypothetical protein